METKAGVYYTSFTEHFAGPQMQTQQGQQPPTVEILRAEGQLKFNTIWWYSSIGSAYTHRGTQAWWVMTEG